MTDELEKMIDGLNIRDDVRADLIRMIEDTIEKAFRDGGDMVREALSGNDY